VTVLNAQAALYLAAGWYAAQGNQHELAGAAARFEVLVGATRVLERVALADPPVELAGGDPAEDLARAPLELLARGDVVRQPGPRDVERALAQVLELVRRHGPAGHAVEDERPAATQRRQAAGERVLGDPVEDDRHAVAAGELAHALREAVVAERPRRRRRRAPARPSPRSRWWRSPARRAA
jgi:hypothetical protein